MTKKHFRNIFISTITIFALTLGFYNNFFGVIKQDKFNEYDTYCQSQVIGRVIKAEKDGIFSKGGFTGWVKDKNMTWEEMISAQYDLFENGSDVNTSNFVIYDGQVGGQGIIFSFIDKISPLSNKLNLKLFWLLTSLSLAVLLSFFIYWIHENYGFITAIITFLLIIISPWITLFGRNLYWILSSFYFPFIVMLILLYKESKNKTELTLNKLFLISLGTVFVKLFFSGFELITTALVMFAIPLFYYMFLNEWKIKFFFRRFIVIVVGAISSIIVYAIIFAYQLSTIKGSFLSGIDHMLYSFFKRTNGNSENFPEAFKDSLEANVLDVIKPYLNSTILKLGYLKVNFLSLFIVLIIFSVLVFGLKDISKSLSAHKKKYFTLVLITWISILAPLSWLVIFKAHSYIHLAYNAITWYMPFCLFGFVLIGSAGSDLVKDIISYIKKRKIKINNI